MAVLRSSRYSSSKQASGTPNLLNASMKTKKAAKDLAEGPEGKFESSERSIL
jgi:hypothetical protein